MEPEGPSYNTLPKVPLHKETAHRLLPTHLSLHHFTKLPSDATVYADSRQEKVGARSRAWTDAQREERAQLPEMKSSRCGRSWPPGCCFGACAHGEDADPTPVLGNTDGCLQAQRWGDRESGQPAWKVELQERVKGGSKGPWAPSPSAKVV